MTTDTVFWIASMTKAITSMAAMQLVERNKLTLDQFPNSRLQEADLKLRDMVDNVGPVMQQADQHIAYLNALASTNRIGDVLERRQRFVNIDQDSLRAASGYRPDPQGMIERELGWRETGIAPGISHADLVDAHGEVAAAAKAAPTPPAPKARPEGWGTKTPDEIAQERHDRAVEIVKAEGRISSVRLQREFGVGMPEAGRIRDQLMAEGVIDERGAVPVEGAGEGGKKSGAITAPKAKQAAPTKPLRLEEAYPELSVEKMSAEERAELQAAHDAMMKLDDHEAA